jgi:hypothetical protein
LKDICDAQIKRWVNEFVWRKAGTSQPNNLLCRVQCDEALSYLLVTMGMLLSAAACKSPSKILLGALVRIPNYSNLSEVESEGLP